jgi:hypothetical protein
MIFLKIDLMEIAFRPKTKERLQSSVITIIFPIAFFLTFFIRGFECKFYFGMNGFKRKKATIIWILIRRSVKYIQTLFRSRFKLKFFKTIHSSFFHTISVSYSNGRLL